MATAERTINLPLELVKKALDSREKTAIVAFSVYIKLKASSSCLFFESERKLRAELHCGKRKVDTIIRAIKTGSSLFSAGNGRIVATSFKKMFATKVRYGKHSQTYAMNAIKLTADTNNLTLSGIEKKIRLLYAQWKINAKQRQDEFTLLKSQRSAEVGQNPSRAKSTALTLRKLAKGTGRSVSTICKYVKELERLALISVERHLVTKTEDGGYTQKCNKYSIAHRSLQKRFAHIIYGHTGRVYSETVAKLGQNRYGNEYWD